MTMQHNDAPAHPRGAAGNLIADTNQVIGQTLDDRCCFAGLVGRTVLRNKDGLFGLHEDTSVTL